MSKKDLAILGGDAVINSNFQKYNPIGTEELNAAKDVIKTGVLSQFVGAHDQDFYGGPKVKEFEKMCCDYFNVDRSKRTYHGALIDVELTAQVFLKMIDKGYIQEEK